MLFFQIQAAHNLFYIKTLIPLIYSPQNFYFITIDKNKELESKEIIEYFKRFTNICVSTTSYVTWGGVSQINTMLSGMRYMRELKKYKFYLNISDNDLPLWTQERLCDFLVTNESRGHLAFIQHWRPQVDFDALNEMEDAGISIFQHRSDVKFSINKVIRAYFEDPDRSPIMKPPIRPLLVCYEDPVEKTIHIRQMTETEKFIRTNFFSKNEIYVGRQWVVFHYSIIFDLLENNEFILFYKMFSDIFIPDEMFFQSIMVKLFGGRNIIVNDNLRFRAGTPTSISDSDIAELHSSQSAFARKLNFGAADGLLRWADAKFETEVAFFKMVT